MKKPRNEYLILGALFLFVLAFRLFFAFSVQHFNSDEAYFHLRHINYFIENFSSIEYDQLSYGGRFVFYPPLFHVFMGLISFGSVFLLKLVPELLLSMTVFIVYAAAKDISGNSYSALFAAGLSGFVPMLFSETLNNISIYSFVIPIIFLMLYSLSRLDNKKYLWIFIFCSFLLPLTHASALIFAVACLLYFLITAGGAILPSRIEKEGVLFSVLVIIFFEFIVYKVAFLEFGAGILKHNIPSNILADNFRQILPLDLFVGAGMLSIVLGSAGIYFAMLRDKKKISYIFGAFALAVLLLVSLRLLTISTSILFFGIVMSIFSSLGVLHVYEYFSKFKMQFVKHYFAVLLVVLFFLFSVSPSFLVAKTSPSIDSSTLRDVEWLMKNTDENDVILADVTEGHLIAALAGRKTVIDSNFIFAPDPRERADDINIVYTTVSEAVALKTLNKYDVDVIYMSDNTRRRYGVINLAYGEKLFSMGDELVEAGRCFDLRRNSFYVVKC